MEQQPQRQAERRLVPACIPPPPWPDLRERRRSLQEYEELILSLRPENRCMHACTLLACMQRYSDFDDENAD